MRGLRHAAHTGEKINVYKTLLGKPKGKRPHGRPRHKWLNNIKTEFRNRIG
jgi:hypothetical protein